MQYLNESLRFPAQTGSNCLWPSLETLTPNGHALPWPILISWQLRAGGSSALDTFRARAWPKSEQVFHTGINVSTSVPFLGPFCGTPNIRWCFSLGKANEHLDELDKCVIKMFPPTSENWAPPFEKLERATSVRVPCTSINYVDVVARKCRI